MRRGTKGSAGKTVKTKVSAGKMASGAYVKAMAALANFDSSKKAPMENFLRTPILMYS